MLRQQNARCKARTMSKAEFKCKIQIDQHTHTHTCTPHPLIHPLHYREMQQGKQTEIESLAKQPKIASLCQMISLVENELTNKQTKKTKTKLLPTNKNRKIKNNSTQTYTVQNQRESYENKNENRLNILKLTISGEINIYVTTF